MRDVIQTASEVSLSALQELLAATAWTWAYTERQADIVLTKRAALLEGNQAPVAQWEHGRAFNAELEISWWQRGASYDVRWIATTAMTAPVAISWNVLDTSEWTASEQRWLLIGERDANRKDTVPTWSVARIPRYLPYPLELEAGASSPTRVALVSRLYRVRHVPRITRLLRVEEV